MTRLNRSSRQSPTDLDEPPSKVVDYNFDYRRCSEPGKPSWPEKHSGVKFGPSFIRKAWQSGLIVVAEIHGFPHPVAAMEVKWTVAGVLVVKTLEGFKVPERLWTRPNAKGMTSSGLLIEGE